MLKKVVYAGVQSASFVQATKDLAALAELPVSRERVQRWTKRVGHERLVEAEAGAAAYQALPLPEQRCDRRGPVPQIACVQMDGGRIQVRPRGAPAETKGYWRETLVGCLLSMVGAAHAQDPCPELPRTFVDPRKMADLGREIKGFCSAGDLDEKPPDETDDDRLGRPRPLVRSLVATRAGVDVLGPRLVAAAHARGFHAAPRKAFVADGSATNWGVHRKFFSHYTPILDFTHAVCYVYAAAMAGRSATDGWKVYVPWAQWLWAGDTAALMAALEARSQELGPPSEEAPETCPRRIVAEALRYVENQQARMNYAAYRRQGLPITSSAVESAIKQVNRRMKGTEKFWDQGAEPLLQLVADHLSETQDLPRFWRRRCQRLAPSRSYHAAA